MSYFLQAGVDINGYDPAFKKYYKKVFGDSKGIENYYPTNQFGKRDGIYAMWTQTSPESGAWVFKMNASDFNTTPFIAPFLRDAIRDSEIAQLQYNKDMASAYAILVGELRLFNDAKTGTQANQFAIDPKQVGAFMSKARAGLDSAIKLAALPTENTKWYQFEDKNKEMYSNQLSATAGVGSGLSRVIYSSDRQSNAEIEAGMTEMYSTMKQIYPQFQNFLEFFVNQQTKKYHWRFIFEGSNYKFEREARFDKLIKLADRGMVMPPSVWGATAGYNPFDFEDLLLETKESDWINKIARLLPNTNTTSQKSVGGRPRSDGSELTESGEASRDSLEETEGD